MAKPNIGDLIPLVTEDEFNEHKADYTYQKAGGTATAITLVINEPLEDGYPMTFIASANNNGAATTINGKRLYKPNTTETPNLIKGKAYTVWYNSTNDCFFIKASAEGNAVAENVLAGKTFSNDNDTGVLGSMPNIGKQIGRITTKGEKIFIDEGYHDGTGYINYDDPNHIAGNIAKNKVVGGVIGVYFPDMAAILKEYIPIFGGGYTDTTNATGYVGINQLQIGDIIVCCAFGPLRNEVTQKAFYSAYRFTAGGTSAERELITANDYFNIYYQNYSYPSLSVRVKSEALDYLGSYQSGIGAIIFRKNNKE